MRSVKLGGDLRGAADEVVVALRPAVSRW